MIFEESLCTLCLGTKPKCPNYNLYIKPCIQRIISSVARWRKVRGRSYLARKVLPLCRCTKRWQLLLVNGERPCFKCLLDCILLTKNFIQAKCSPTGVQHCLSCCGTMTVNVLNWKKVSSYEINSHQINFPWGQLPQNRLNAIFNIQIYQNTELIWWITHDKVNSRSAIICLFYTGFAGTEKRIMTACTQIEKVADAKQ